MNTKNVGEKCLAVSSKHAMVIPNEHYQDIAAFFIRQWFHGKKSFFIQIHSVVQSNFLHSPLIADKDLAKALLALLVFTT